MSAVGGEHPLLAVANVARLRYSLRDPRMTEFVDGIERINRLANETPGFVWRLRGEAGHSALRSTADGQVIIVNVTLWTDYLALHRFTYQGLHGRYLTARERWFVPLPGYTTALWWVQASHRPDVDEALARLRLLRREGPSRRAFTVLRRWNADGTVDRTSQQRRR